MSYPRTLPQQFERAEELHHLAIGSFNIVSGNVFPDLVQAGRRVMTKNVGAHTPDEVMCCFLCAVIGWLTISVAFYFLLRCSHQDF